METNRDGDGDSQKRRLDTLERVNSDLFKEMRKEMDELRNVIKEKMDWSLDKNGQEDRFTFHHGNSGVPSTLKASSTPTRTI